MKNLLIYLVFLVLLIFNGCNQKSLDADLSPQNTKISPTTIEKTLQVSLKDEKIQDLFKNIGIEKSGYIQEMDVENMKIISFKNNPKQLLEIPFFTKNTKLSSFFYVVFNLENTTEFFSYIIEKEEKSNTEGKFTGSFSFKNQDKQLFLLEEYENGLSTHLTGFQPQILNKSNAKSSAYDCYGCITREYKEARAECENDPICDTICDTFSCKGLFLAGAYAECLGKYGECRPF